MDEKTCTSCHEAKPLDAFAMERNRTRKPVRRAHCKACRNEYSRALYGRLQDARWRGRAHKAVTRARARGDLLPQPCERCGAANAVAHHDDYSKPLDVKWLCHEHHGQRHRDIRRACAALALTTKE